MAGKSIGKKLNSSATMDLWMVVSSVAMFMVVKYHNRGVALAIFKAF